MHVRVIDNVCMMLEEQCLIPYIAGIRQFVSCPNAKVEQMFKEPSGQREIRTRLEEEVRTLIRSRDEIQVFEEI